MNIKNVTIKNSTDASFIRFNNKSFSVLKDSFFVMSIHFTRYLPRNNGDLEHIYVGKKTYNFLIPKALGELITNRSTENKCPQLINLSAVINKPLAKDTEFKLYYKRVLVTGIRPFNPKNELDIKYKHFIPNDLLNNLRGPKTHGTIVIADSQPEYLDKLIKLMQEKQ